MHRQRRTIMRYRTMANPAACPFCRLDTAELIEESAHAAVIRSRFPYDFWELQPVTDHLLVIPKQHAAGLSHVSQTARQEIMEFISKYEHLGYNVYSRAEKSVNKSIPEHQHTHLFATTEQQARFALFLTKPYWLFRR